MPKKKDEPKTPMDMTTDEAIKELLPPEVVEELKELVRCDEPESVDFESD